MLTKCKVLTLLVSPKLIFKRHFDPQEYFVNIIEQDIKEYNDFIVEGIEVNEVYRYFYRKYYGNKVINKKK